MVFSTDSAHKAAGSYSVDSASKVQVLLKSIPWESVLSDIMITLRIEKVCALFFLIYELQNI